MVTPEVTSFLIMRAHLISKIDDIRESTFRIVRYTESTCKVEGGKVTYGLV